jgi:hypothetical protein
MATGAQIEKLRKRLISVAKSNSPRVAYSAIDQIVGLNVSAIPADRGKLGSILATMGAREVNAGRPFLPAVVVRKGSQRPGPGFYPEVRRLCDARYHSIQGDARLHDAVLQDVQCYWQAAK